MRFASPAQLAQTQAVRADAVSAMAKQEHSDFVQRMRDEHANLVSGNVKESTLRALDHPFARRHITGLDKAVRRARLKNLMGAANIRLLPINIQSGRLLRSLYLQHKAGGDGDTVQSFDVGFGASYAKYVLARRGTKRMIARQFVQAKQRIERKRERELRQRIQIGIVRIHAQTLTGAIQ